VRPDYLAPDVKLLRYSAIGRVCDVCYDMADPELMPVSLARA
jgi:hypothetical protein